MNLEQQLKIIEEEVRSLHNNADKDTQLERLEEVMATYKGEDKVISSLDICEKVKRGESLPDYSTGYDKLDTLLGGGFRPKQVVTITAATKSGKTSFCVDLTVNMKDYNPLWLSFEESVEELVEKFVDRGETPPLFYTPEMMRGNNMEWVEQKVVESKVKYNTKIVFIDHLHFLVPFSTQRLDTEIGNIMRTLKRIARQWNVVIVLIAHIKKTNMDEVPTLADLRDSSFVAQESDTVMVLWRQAVKDSKRQIQITNNMLLDVQAVRRGKGKPGKVKFVFDDGHFKQIEWADEEAVKAFDEDF